MVERVNLEVMAMKKFSILLKAYHHMQFEIILVEWGGDLLLCRGQKLILKLKKVD